MKLFTRFSLLIFSLACILVFAGCAGTASVAEEKPMMQTAPVTPAVKAPEMKAAAVSEEQSEKGEKNSRLFPYEEITLDNGLKVISLEDHSCPIVSVQVWYRIGSRYEDPKRQGFAHMFEHMMFKGTDRLGPTDHFDLIRSVGGSTNAYTSFDQTVYVETIPSNQLQLALWLEAERMSFLKIDQESFDTERKVVEEERRMGQNRPFGDVFEKALAAIFKHHPYKWSPIGNISHLRASSVSELRKWWHDYYTPNNAVLVVSGDVTHSQVQKLARKYFGWIPAVKAEKKKTEREPDIDKPEEITLKLEKAPVPACALVWRTVGAADKDVPALDILSIVLGQGESSRLYNRLVRETGIAVQAQALHYNLQQDGIFAVIGGLMPVGGDMDKVLTELRKEIAKIRKNGITEEELEKAKNIQLRNLVFGMNRVSSKSSMLGSAAVLCGDTDEVNHEIEHISRLTVEDIKNAALKYLSPNKMIVFRVPKTGMLKGLKDLVSEKKEEEASEITAEPETEAPAPGRPGEVRPAGYPSEPPINTENITVPAPEPATRTLENGLKVIVIRNTEVPLVSVRLAVPYGSWCEAKPGSANLALSLISKGTQKHSEEELAAELERYAISISGSANVDSSSVNGSCVTDQFPRMMELFGEIIRTPSFPERSFAIAKNQLESSLAVKMKNPKELARLELRKLVYGTHPYSRPMEGTAEDIKNLTRDDLVKLWKQYARPSDAVLVFAGDITEKDAFESAKNIFAGWTAEGDSPEKEIPEVKKPDTTRIYLIDVPDSGQSEIQIGQYGIPQSDPEYPVLNIVGSYFGGSFGSRLNNAVRVEKGLTYGAFGWFAAARYGGRFVTETFTKTPKTAETLSVLIEQIRKLVSDPPTEDELLQQKQYYLGSIPAQYETAGQVASKAAHIALEGYPDDYYTKLYTDIGNTTAQDCMKFIHRVLDPEKLIIVIAGDAAKIQKDLEKIAPVTVVKP